MTGGMPAVILAASAIGQLHHRVIGHLARPVQRQKIAAKPRSNEPLAAAYFRNLYDPLSAYAPDVAALLHFFLQ